MEADPGGEGAWPLGEVEGEEEGGGGGERRSSPKNLDEK